jgi:hypothetical protein
MAVHGLSKTANFSNQRRTVVATADVALQQVQVVDKNGQIRSIILWRCGPDSLYADTLDGLFDNSRRKKAPEWLVAQLSELPAERQFHSDGTKKGGSPEKVPDHLPTSDADAPGFVQG